MEEEIRKIIAVAVLAVILANAAACGGNGGDGGEERLHPVLPNHIYLQIQEGREYIVQWGDISNLDLSDRINAIHQGGYEIEHATSDEDGNILIVFRKIPRAEESAPPAGTTPSN